MTTHADQGLARTLAQTYTYERSRYQCLLSGRPVRYRLPACWRAEGRLDPETRGASVWLRLVRLCRGRQVDPVCYVQWCLAMDTLHGKQPPEPNQLLSAARLDEYIAARAKEPDQLRLAWHIQAGAARREISYHQRFGHMTADDSYVMVLRDANLELSGLFRYCLARTLKGPRFRRIAEDFEAAALLQYQRAPVAYDAAWGAALIPPEFAERAARYYARVIREC